MINFSLPYFATSLRDFWHKWHISLSTWLRDYLYISLGGSRRTEARTFLNLGITMLLGGLWHGAALNFVLWGLFQGVGLIANRLWERHRPAWLMLPGWVGWMLTQAFVLYGWMLFRSTSLDQVVAFTRALGNLSLPGWWQTYVTNLLLLASPLLLMQIWQLRSGRLDVPLQLRHWQRAALQGSMLMLIACFWEPQAVPFIYFQF
jgi:D-alanyl-lipoteichoic acid acyltransferase DltB (MBOAT superfamily)